MPKKKESYEIVNFDELFEFGEPEPRKQYRVVFYEPVNIHAPIPGYQTKKSHSFEWTPDMTTAALELSSEIRAWQRIKNNAVEVEVHEVQCPNWGDLTLYVQMKRPSLRVTSRHAPTFAVPEREFEELKRYIKNITVQGHYPPLPILPSI
jgi:hypothetical protein